MYISYISRISSSVYLVYMQDISSISRVNVDMPGTTSRDFQGLLPCLNIILCV